MKFRSAFLAAIVAGITAFAFSAFSPQLAQAQSSGSVQAQNPLTRDIGAILTFATQVAATVNSADQSGFNVSRVTCVLNQSAEVGTMSTTFKIQNKDAASGTYYDLITSAATTVNATPNAVTAGAGVATTTNVSANLPIARTWRVQAIVTGTTSMSGTIGCSLQ